MSSDDNSLKNGGSGNAPLAADASQQEFTPEQLRQAARTQIILYVVMAFLIVLPFIVFWLRKDDQPAPETAPSAGAVVAPQTQAGESGADQ